MGPERMVPRSPKSFRCSAERDLARADSPLLLPRVDSPLRFRSETVACARRAAFRNPSPPPSSARLGEKTKRLWSAVVGDEDRGRREAGSPTGGRRSSSNRMHATIRTLFSQLCANQARAVASGGAGLVHGSRAQRQRIQRRRGRPPCVCGYVELTVLVVATIR